MIYFKNRELGTSFEEQVSHCTESRANFPNGVCPVNGTCGNQLFPAGTIYQKVLPEFFLHRHAVFLEKRLQGRG
jgi:hypothetical protein